MTPSAHVTRPLPQWVKQSWRLWTRLGLSRPTREVLRALQKVVRDFRGEDLGLRASALTFVSIFSLIPLVTVTLAAVDWLGEASLRQRLLDVVQEVLAPGIRDDSAAFLERFVLSASSRTAGGIGLLTLAFSASALIRNLDASLNAIWNVRTRRSWPLRIVTYVGVLALGPMFLAAWVGSTSWLTSLLQQWELPYSNHAVRLVSPLLSVAGFSFVYGMAPNTRVRPRAAILGGLIAGLSWELAKHLYAKVAGHFIQTNPVYGALGAAPLFLLWLQLSWLLFLLGARLAYAIHSASLRGAVHDLGTHPRAKELLAAALAQAATGAQLKGKVGPTPRQLARRLRVSEERITEVIELLERANLVRRQRGGTLVPARPPNEMTLADLSTAVGGFARLLKRSLPDSSDESLRDVERHFLTGDGASLERLRGITWESLLRELPAASAGTTTTEAPQKP